MFSAYIAAQAVPSALVEAAAIGQRARRRSKMRDIVEARESRPGRYLLPSFASCLIDPPGEIEQSACGKSRLAGMLMSGISGARRDRCRNTCSAAQCVDRRIDVVEVPLIGCRLCPLGCITRDLQSAAAIDALAKSAVSISREASPQWNAEVPGREPGIFPGYRAWPGYRRRCWASTCVRVRDARQSVLRPCQRSGGGAGCSGIAGQPFARCRNHRYCLHHSIPAKCLAMDQPRRRASASSMPAWQRRRRMYRHSARRVGEDGVSKSTEIALCGASAGLSRNAYFMTLPPRRDRATRTCAAALVP